MDKDEQETLPTAPEVVKAPKKVPVAVSVSEPEADAPKADEPSAETVDAVDTEPAPEPEPAQPVPQLIRSTASTKKPEPAAEPDASVEAEPEQTAEVAQPSPRASTTKPEPTFWTEKDKLEEDDDTKEYDPRRGDYVDHLNDTTPRTPALSKPKKPTSRKAWVWVLVVLLLAAAGAGAYFYLGGNKAAAPAPPTTQSSSAQQAEKPTATATVKTKHYDSTNFSMALDYPESWKISETPTLLSVASPQTSLKTSDGTKADGYIFVTVQPKQSTLPDFAKGSAVAVLQSEKVAYKNPTQNQRAQTYLTFASYATTKGKGWDALYVTGDNGYQVDQYIPMSDIVQTDPLVTVKFLSCTSQTCTGSTKALTLDSSEWKNTAVSAPIKTIIQSFAFQ